MCGISGIVGKHINNSNTHSVIKKMTDSISHRGPNAEGFWNDEHCFFGHRRLSVIDLSDAANQPFISQDKRYIIIYNGEIYNYKSLKLELQRAQHGSKNLPYFFKTNSDTEVILAAFLRWGNDCFTKFNGMFSIAIWDTLEQKLIITRDRLGIKPLYYHVKNDILIFASEIRALINSGIIEKKVNHLSLAEYIQYSTVHAPNTILQNVFMLKPGCLIEYQNNKLLLKQYWNINDYNTSSNDLSYQDTCKKVNELLTQAVERQLISDVLFGAFLSGGIDSSAIVGLMSKVTSEKIQTFNVSFNESEFSESNYATQISKKFNTTHHNIKVSAKDFLNELPEALQAIDHPSGDGINSFIVARATKQEGVTVALSGLGSDELFAGYDIFKHYYALEKKSWLNLIPAKNIASKLITLKNKTIKADKTSEILQLSLINGYNAYPINRKLFNSTDFNTISTSTYRSDHFIKASLNQKEIAKNHILSSVSLLEIQTYMQNVLLRDTDQMSMAVALEVRVPFLDHTLVEFVLGVKDDYKYPTTPKKLLIDSLENLLPDNISNRSKMGFVLPWKNWLKEELRDFCEENIIQFAKRSFVNREAVISIWNRFLNNDPKITWSRIWHLVVLNNWLNTHHIED